MFLAISVCCNQHIAKFRMTYGSGLRHHLHTANRFTYELLPTLSKTKGQTKTKTSQCLRRLCWHIFRVSSNYLSLAILIHFECLLCKKWGTCGNRQNGNGCKQNMSHKNTLWVRATGWKSILGECVCTLGVHLKASSFPKSFIYAISVRRVRKWWNASLWRPFDVIREQCS